MLRWIFRYFKYRSLARLALKGDVRGLAMRSVRKRGYRQIRRVK